MAAVMRSRRAAKAAGVVAAYGLVWASVGLIVHLCWRNAPLFLHGQGVAPWSFTESLVAFLLVAVGIGILVIAEGA